MCALEAVPTILAPSQPILHINTVLGEGPVWEAETGMLHFVDVGSNCLHHFHYETKVLTTDYYDCMIGSVALRKNKPGFIAAAQYGFAFLPPRLELSSPENPTKIEFITNPIDEEVRHLRMFNDGACDSSGRFYAGMKIVRGVPMDNHLKLGKIFRFHQDDDGKLVADLVTNGYTIPNGIGFSKDSSTMYIADTRANRIMAYDYSEDTGKVDGERVFATTPFLGRPDGLCLDSEDRIYSAKWAGQKVSRYLPDGTIDLEIFFENAYNITAPVFGGPNMDILFVTTGSLKESLEDKEPSLRPFLATSGDLYAVHIPGVKGVEKRRFGW